MVSDILCEMNSQWQHAEAPTFPSARYRAWLWPSRIWWRLAGGVPVGLWMLNGFCQRILRIHAHVPWPVHFTSYVIGDVRIGRNVWKSFAISAGCYIQGGNGVEIGDDTLFAPGVKIISANHGPAHDRAWVKGTPVRIGRCCWIGANAVILPGVELGDETIVGAGAVVTRSFPGGHCILVGVPARVAHRDGPGPGATADARDSGVSMPAAGDLINGQ